LTKTDTHSNELNIPTSNHPGNTRTRDHLGLSSGWPRIRRGTRRNLFSRNLCVLAHYRGLDQGWVFRPGPKEATLTLVGARRGALGRKDLGIDGRGALGTRGDDLLACRRLPALLGSFSWLHASFCAQWILVMSPWPQFTTSRVPTSLRGASRKRGDGLFLRRLQSLLLALAVQELVLARGRGHAARGALQSRGALGR
jgi:hypothetical protein